MDVLQVTLGQHSKQIRALFFWGTATGSLWVLATWILSGSFNSLMIGGLAIILIAALLATLDNWRTGLLLFFLWLLFEDLARKYFGNGLILLFGKDALAAIVYLSFWMAKRRGKSAFFRPPFLAPLAVFFSLAFIQVFNTWTPSFLYGFLGLKLYFYYFPLLYIGFTYLQTARDLERLLVYNIVLGTGISVLGIVQSIIGLKFLNPSVLAPELRELGNLTRYSPLSNQAVVAPTSVFVSAGRFSHCVIVLLILALGGQAYLLLTRRRQAVYGLLGIGTAVVAAMQSASRATTVYVAISTLILSAGFLWGAPLGWKQGRPLLKALRRGFMVSAVALLLMVLFFPSALGASWSFYSETLSPTSPASELRNRTWDYPLDNLMVALRHPRWLYGDGTGTASLGMQYVAKVLGQAPINFWVENGWGTLILEMGILGPILWIVWTSSLLYFSWKIVQQLRLTVYFPVALSIFWYAFLLLVPFTYGGIAPYQDYIMNAYLWFWVGVLFRLPYLARQEEIGTASLTARGPSQPPLAL